jgi:hypothetical protein
MQNRPKKVQAGVYTFLGYTIFRSKNGKWFASLDDRTAAYQPSLQNRFPAAVGYAKTRDELLPMIAEQQVMTYNMLNRAAGEFPISWQNKGTCCDPATESYHCM